MERKLLQKSKSLACSHGQGGSSWREVARAPIVFAPVTLGDVLGEAGAVMETGSFWPGLGLLPMSKREPFNPSPPPPEGGVNPNLPACHEPEGWPSAMGGDGEGRPWAEVVKARGPEAALALRVEGRGAEQH